MAGLPKLPKLPSLPKLNSGSNKRFSDLEDKLRNQGAKDPSALAAWISRRKRNAST